MKRVPFSNQRFESGPATLHLPYELVILNHYVHKLGRESKMERPGCKCSLATDERYNDGKSSGNMWNDKRSMQTQGNMVVE